jgi:hypothetical protein
MMHVCGSLTFHAKTRSANREACFPFTIFNLHLQRLCTFVATQQHPVDMAARPLTALARVRPSSQISSAILSQRSILPYATAFFSTSALRAATPAGPPPQGFRLARRERWDEGSESSLDKAGKYFLLTEMFGGMYVVLEQFFRPP